MYCIFTVAGEAVQYVLPSALRDAITKKWYEQGIKIFGDLYENDTLMTFEQLSRTFHLPAANFFKYLQVRHFISTLGNSTPTRLLPIDDILKDVTHPRGITFNRISALSDIAPLNARTKWERDLNFTFELND